ncbi:hypothetical protein HK102_007124 [Quaeritorhiza haematococci]|nr:hypothetical protein HK102_007124 [Quaeritorhiza haematococci]
MSAGLVGIPAASSPSAANRYDNRTGASGGAPANARSNFIPPPYPPYRTTSPHSPTKMHFETAGSHIGRKTPTKSFPSPQKATHENVTGRPGSPLRGEYIQHKQNLDQQQRRAPPRSSASPELYPLEFRSSYFRTAAAEAAGREAAGIRPTTPLFPAEFTHRTENVSPRREESQPFATHAGRGEAGLSTSAGVDGTQPAAGGFFDPALLLRHRLDQMGYKDYDFDIGSLPLLRRLLADLINAVDAASKFRNKSDEEHRELLVWKDQVEPLRQEISRLTDENNQLHMDVIRLSDERDARERRFAQLLRRHEQERADLSFVCSQYAHKVQAEQKKAEHERQKIEDALEKQGVIGVGGAGSGEKDGKSSKTAKGDSLVERLQKIDIETGLPPLEHPPIAFPPPDPVVADMVKLAEARISNLEDDKKNLELRNVDLENQLQMIRDQLVKREQEIHRLGNQLEISRAKQYLIPLSKKPSNINSPSRSKDATGSGEHNNDKDHLYDLGIAKARIEQLEMMVEHLQEHAEALEKEIAAVGEEKAQMLTEHREETEGLRKMLERERGRVRDMEAGYLEMERDLEELGEEVKKREEQMRQGVGVVATKLGKGSGTVKAKEKPTSVTSRLPEKKPQPSGGKAATNDTVKTLEQKLKFAEHKLSTVQLDYERATEENQELRRSLQETREQLETLKGEFEKLVAKEKPAKKTPEKRGGSRGSETDQEKEEEKQMYKEREKEVEEILNKLRDRESEVRALEGRIEDLLRRASEKVQNEEKKCAEDALSSAVMELRRKVEESRDALEEVRREKDEVAGKLRSMANERDQIQRERDQLVLALQNFESQLEDLQRHVEMLTADRDNYAHLYEQVNGEVQVLRKKNVPSTSSAPPSDVETTKEALRSDASPLPPAQVRADAASEKKEREHISEHNHQLNDHLNNKEKEEKTTQSDETDTNDINIDGKNTHGVTLLRLRNAELEERVKGLEIECENLRRDLQGMLVRQQGAGSSALETLRQLETERDGLKTALESKERERLLLEDQMAALAKHVQRVEEENLELEKKVDGARNKMRQVEVEKDRETFNVREARSKASETASKLERLQAELARTRSDYEDAHKQIKDLRNLLAEVDKERDEFQAEMDRKAERILELEGAVSKLKSDSLTMEQEVFGLREQNDVLNSHLNEQDRELASLHRQLENAIRERDDLAGDVKRFSDELDAVASDMNAVTKENHILTSELTQVSSDRDRLKSELEECEKHIRFLEGAVEAKETERDQIMMTYRKLISEHEKLELQMRTSSEEGSNMRMEVIMRDKRVQQLQKAVDELASELTNYKIDINAFEKQCSNLTRLLATSERTVAHLESEKSRMAREITAARDLAMTIEHAKDDMHKQLTAVAIENEHLMSNARKLETDVEALSNELRAEDMHNARGNLEEQLQHLNQQQAASIQSLKQQLTSTQDECRVQKARIEALERSLVEQRKALSTSQEEVDRLQNELVELKAQLQNKEQIIKDILEIKADNEDNIAMGKTDLERRILSELANTKRQLRKYEAQIARRFRPQHDRHLSSGGHSSSSQHFSNTPGESDLSSDHAPQSRGGGWMPDSEEGSPGLRIVGAGSSSMGGTSLSSSADDERDDMYGDLLMQNVLSSSRNGRDSSQQRLKRRPGSSGSTTSTEEHRRRAAKAGDQMRDKDKGKSTASTTSHGSASLRSPPAAVVDGARLLNAIVQVQEGFRDDKQ